MWSTADCFRALIVRTQHTDCQLAELTLGWSTVQIMRQLQELAAAQELRFEVSREPALCFEVRSAQLLLARCGGSCDG